MRHRKLLILPALLASVAAVVIPRIGQAAAPHHSAGLLARPCAIAVWSVVPSPNNGTDVNILYGVSAASPYDVWAVGYTNLNSSTGPAQTLVEHWNGASWSVVASPNLGSSFNILTGVVAISSSNVWAVGYYYKSMVGQQTLVEHWNGASWSVVTSPDVGTLGNSLAGVAATSADDIWAVGNYEDANTTYNQTLIEHWNGASWSVVASPQGVTGYNYLNAVAAITPRDAWAVGSAHDPVAGVYPTLIEHWDGTQWKVVPSPSVASAGNALSAVAAVSATDMWATGSSNAGNYMTLTEHYDGTGWSIVASPDSTIGHDVLAGVAAIPRTTRVWTVGASGVLPLQPLVEQWNGASWVMTPSPVAGVSGPTLAAVTVLTATSAWAVGGYIPSSKGSPTMKTLIEHYHVLPTGAPCLG